MGAVKRRQSQRERKDELLDEALKETFPASDPPALIDPGGGISGTGELRRERRPVNRKSVPASPPAPEKASD